MKPIWVYFRMHIKIRLSYQGDLIRVWRDTPKSDGALHPRRNRELRSVCFGTPVTSPANTGAPLSAPPSYFRIRKFRKMSPAVVTLSFGRASHGHMWCFTLQGNGSVEATFSMARFRMLGVSGPRQVGQQLSFWRQWLQTR